jgi:hypothetical protein
MPSRGIHVETVKAKPCNFTVFYMQCCAIQIVYANAISSSVNARDGEVA